VKADPYGLPEGFTWCTLDVRNPDRKDLTELYKLLSENYVEDDDAMFRFEYSAEFLLWALTPPDTFPEWIVGVRAKPTGKLVACITGVTAHMNVYERPVLLCEINFLCVHKKLRSKRLAPVLIKEVTRRVNLRDIWQATYTAGAVLPKPVASCQYWHRSLNSKKLIDIRFSSLPPRMTLARLQRLHALPEEPQIKGTRALAAADVPEACALLNAHLRTFSLAPVYSEAEFAHWFLPRAGVIESYVVANEDLPAGKQVTDFLSFFHLPSSVINHDRYKTMNAAYSYYNVPGAHSFASIMQESLILAKRSGIDVFNALDLMQNDPALLKDLKFGPGDGKLQYYLYNWACPEMPPSKVGLVLL
jgi:glycylpeptide N-tetradecanoyltransferase